MTGPQHEVLGTTDPVEAAQAVVKMTIDASEAMQVMVDATIISQGQRPDAQVLTALEQLRNVQDTATWGIRMLIELTGKAKRDDRYSRKWPSQRKMVTASGVSLASIHEWINHPAGPSTDGASGPGTLAKPGQTNHRFNNRQSGDQDAESDDYEADN